MRPVTWYSDDLGDRDPLSAMRESCERFRSLTASWSPADYERTYAPGKWSARQVFIHLAQNEIALGYRVRMALATPQYQAQNFDQDLWMAHEQTANGADAVEAVLALNRLNRALFESLSSEDRAVGMTHPEIGALTVDWVIHQMAGHQIHHLRQLEGIKT